MKKRYLNISLCILIFVLIANQFLFSDYDEKRENLVKEHIIKEGIKDKNVINSMLSVPREEFVPDYLMKMAYINRPLPIGYGQTISQPYIVALMTELLALNKNDTVLEIGTGSGYQAAILSQIVEKVYTIEIIKPLYLQAKERFKSLNYNNIICKLGDGYYGLEDYAPFDAIIVTAAADHIPPPLIKQLKNGGRMCIPVGQLYYPQVLKLLKKNKSGNIYINDIAPVRFVPLVREYNEQ